MTDVHSHILFEVDDGSQSLDESIEILKKMKEVGFDNVIFTPHYIEGSEYCSNNLEKEEKLEIIKKELKKNNIDINIYLSNEIFINNNIYELINSNIIHPYNDTKYILVELPFHNQIVNLEDIIYELKIKGLIPIIAHPERYTYFQENYKIVDKLRNEGFLFQCNYSSIIGYYGKESQKLIKYMLKKEYVDYLGTDIHKIKNTFVLDNFKKIEKNIIKITKKDYYLKIQNNNSSLKNSV